MATEKTAKIEDLFSELDGIIENMEKDGISLEESFQLYEKGVKTIQECQKTMDMVEKKMMVLNASNELEEFS